MKKIIIFCSFSVLIFCAACSGKDVSYTYPDSSPPGHRSYPAGYKTPSKSQYLFGHPVEMTFFKKRKAKSETEKKTIEKSTEEQPIKKIDNLKKLPPKKISFSNRLSSFSNKLFTQAIYTNSIPQSRLVLAATDAISRTNLYLWRASLEVIGFMPLKTVSWRSGLIITNWYETPGNDNERLKLHIIVRPGNLRQDSLSVSIFRQIKKNGVWSFTPASTNLKNKLEEIILKRTRQLVVEANRVVTKPVT